MVDMAASLTGYGADPAALHLLDADGPELLPYATLLAARREGCTVLNAVGLCMNGRRPPCFSSWMPIRLKANSSFTRYAAYSPCGEMRLTLALWRQGASMCTALRSISIR